jgi:thiol-disulfide isomerase/thioredoxin
MPLEISAESASAVEKWLKETATTTGKPAYLVVYASLVNGRSWCGDCRAAEPFVETAFGRGEDVVKVVYAGEQGA